MVNMATVDELKAQGNAAISAHDYPKAVECYTKAIELAPDNHVLYSNRSAAYTSMGQYEKALADAEKTVTLQPSWPKVCNSVLPLSAWCSKFTSLQRSDL
jgi:Flp pilus assembly protein TadD